MARPETPLILHVNNPQVQSLEQHNQVLLTRWNFLREQDNSLSDLDIKLMYDQYMNKLRQQIRSIDTEKEQLDMELDEVLEAMDSFRSRTLESPETGNGAMRLLFTPFHVPVCTQMGA
uniref:Uncharacterized protein n=1 Tax=Sphaerodactylus townsendi TaxID=933632 RepID=A0ACB8EN95_9SAUR